VVRIDRKTRKWSELIESWLGLGLGLGLGLELELELGLGLGLEWKCQWRGDGQPGI
jgi:hypothetical protein